MNKCKSVVLLDESEILVHCKENLIGHEIHSGIAEGILPTDIAGIYKHTKVTVTWRDE